jgi:YD repeat-containing protein
MINALGYRTTFGYDEVGNQTAVWDARGNRFTWVYDALNRLRAPRYSPSQKIVLR